MYLKALEISGFKSFAKKGHFDFTAQTSGIVGPNGSGKSNVAEAFRFVLGEQSLKNMRSKKGVDLIFAGKNGQLNRASVAVIFDNSDKMLDIDYNEVTIERVVLRDGTNEYFINKNKVRAKDVAELLASANVGSAGHHIISQGEADKILMVSARDRKQIIEDALGLKVYTIKKNESVRKLDKTRDNLKEIKLQERTIAPRLAFLKRETEKIEKTRQLRDELRTLYRHYFPGRRKSETDRALYQSQMTDMERQIASLRNRLETTRQEMNSAQSDSRRHQIEEKKNVVETELHSVRTHKNDLERQLGKADAIIEMEESRRDSTEHAVTDSQRLDTVAQSIHGIWQKWASTLLQEESISAERANRWQSRFIPFTQLPRDVQDKDRLHAQQVLSDLGESHASATTFDSTQLEEQQTVRVTILEQLESVSKREQHLQPLLDSLELDLGSPELAVQKIHISVLELEKELAQAESVLRGTRREHDKTVELQAAYDREETYARDLFGKETDAFVQSTVTDQIDLNCAEKIVRTRILLESAGSLSGEEIADEYQELQKRSQYLTEQITDLEHTAVSLDQLTQELNEQIEEKFRAGMHQINDSFNQFFKTLFSGGHAQLQVVNVPVGSTDTDEEQEYELGVEMTVSLPNKKISSLAMLSGGERSLTSIALLFAMSQVTPPPFIILDETDAALDEANSQRYGDMIEQLAQHSQLIVITHNRETMSRAGILYGVTMGDDGVSRLLSVSLDEAESVAK